MDRRDFLFIGASATTLAIAGCSGEDDEEPEPVNNDDNGTDEGEPEPVEDGDSDEGDHEEGSTDGEDTEAVFEFTGLISDGETYSGDEEVVVGAYLQNTGSVAGEQTLELEIAGETVEDEMTLEAGEKTNYGVTFDTASEIDPGEWEYTVRSDDDEITGTFIIAEPAVFEFSNISPDGETFTTEEEVTFGVTVRNTGGQPATKRLQFRISGETIDEGVYELDPGESEDISIAYDASEFGSGTGEFGFYSEDDEITATFTIEEVAEATFEFTEIFPGIESMKQGETVEISTTVKNTGEREGTQDIILEFGDEFSNSLELTLEPGEEGFPTQTVDTGELEIGDYEYTFTSENDEISATLTVEQPAQDVEAVVGDLVESEDMQLVVEDVERGVNLGEYIEPDSGNEFVSISVALKNISGGFVSVSNFLQTRIRDNEDYSYEPTFFGGDEPTFNDGQFAPGEVERGAINFEIPDDASGLELVWDFSTGLFSGIDRAIINLGEETRIHKLEQDLQIDVYDVGTSVEFQDTQVTVNSVRTEESLGTFTEPDAGNEYVIVDISIENNTGEEQWISTVVQMLVKDGEGYSYQEDWIATGQLNRAFDEGTPLADGETRRGEVVYEVEEGLSPLYWVFEFSLWNEGDKTFWKLR